jgi:hypothetical protein
MNGQKINPAHEVPTDGLHFALPAHESLEELLQYHVCTTIALKTLGSRLGAKGFGFP